MLANDNSGKRAALKRSFSFFSFNNALTCDAKVIFEDGSIVYVRTDSLKEASNYFERSESFKQLSQSKKSATEDTIMEIKAQDITPHDEIFKRVLLYMHTHRQDDLNIKCVTACKYLKLADFLEMKAEYDYTLKALAVLEESSDLIEDLYNSLSETFLSETHIHTILDTAFKNSKLCDAAFKNSELCDDADSDGESKICNTCVASDPKASCCTRRHPCDFKCYLHSPITMLSLPLTWLATAHIHKCVPDVMELQPKVRARIKTNQVLRIYNPMLKGLVDQDSSANEMDIRLWTAAQILYSA
ncbi:hypothetical protein DFJ77DRAFT_529635 [Powellomyces hirtus]|nr:hypothetical protein DFJ77DRAFT_529635 [Powellomyces hirtus]